MVACGDDELEPDDMGDEDAGQVDPADLEELDGRLSNVEDSLTGIGDDIDGLGDQIGGLGDDIDGLRDDLNDLGDDVQGRLDALENPEVLSCADTQEELCIPDGIDLVEAGVEPIITQLCRIEVGCCSEEERNYKFGAGIATEEDCVDAFADLINNGFTPGFLRDTVEGATGGIIDSIIAIAQTLNNAGVRIELNTDAIAACASAVEAVECPGEEALLRGTSKSYYSRCGSPAQDYKDELYDMTYIDFGSCQLSEIVRGLQQKGEGCRRVSVTGLSTSEVNDCAAGLICRNSGKGSEGICAEPPTAGDACLEDDDCDTGEDGEELYCDHNQSACAAAGDIGDDCTLKDPTLTVLTYDGGFDGYEGPEEQMRCKDGLRCDPDAKKCVAECSAGHYCHDNLDCGEGLVCNKTANPQLTDQSEGDLGVCSEPIADGDPCTVRNDDSGGPLGASWTGDSECASGICMADPTWVAPGDGDGDGDSEQPIVCAPRGANGDDCLHADTGVADSLSENIRARTFWDCASGYCGPDLKCGAPCGSSSTADVSALQDLGICFGEDAADVLAAYPFLEEWYVDLLTESYPPARIFALSFISNTLSCDAGYYCDDRHKTYGTVGQTAAIVPVCRPLETSEESCGSPADLNDPYDSENNSEMDVIIIGDFPAPPLDGGGEPPLPPHGDGDYSDDYGWFDEWERDREHGGSCVSGQCFGDECVTVDGSGDICRYRGGWIPPEFPIGYDYGDGDGDGWRALNVFNPSVEHDTCQPGLFCDPLAEDLVYAANNRCRDRVAEGGNCRDQRRNICADGLVCLNVDHAFGTFTVGASTLRINADEDENVGEDYGSGVIVNIFDAPSDNELPWVTCSNNHLNVTLGASSGLPTNNTVTEVAALINDDEVCSSYFSATVTGTGSETVSEMRPAVVLEGAYTCVRPPSAIGGTCRFGERGELDCQKYGVDGSCSESTGLCEAPGAAGAECDDHGDCASDLVCNPINGRCAAPGGDGTDCTFEGGPYESLCLDEEPSFSCEEGESSGEERTCLNVGGGAYQCWNWYNRPNGSPCEGEGDGVCTSGFCLYVDDGVDVCAPRLADGAACDRRRVASNEGGLASNSQATESCMDGSYCRYPVDGNVGTCEPKGGTSAACQPYFSLGGSNSWDCLSNICTLQNDRYQCAPYDGDDSLLCGEYIPVPPRVFQSIP